MRVPLRFDDLACSLWRENPGEGNEALAEANDGELSGEGQIGRVKEQDLVQLLPLVLPSPQVEDAQLHALAVARDRRQAHYRVEFKP